MKKIAVFFKQPGAKDYPFTKEEYWKTYQELDREVRDAGAEFYITRDNSTYLGNGAFSKSWQFQDGDLIETGPVTIDKIYDKGEFEPDGKVDVLNNEYVNEICTDKWKTFELFGEFCPLTFKVGNEEELDEALNKLPGDKKVIKPIDDEEGNGVFVGDIEYIKSCDYTFPMLAQEFLDTSGGIPGIYEGIHDLRVVFMNGEIMYSFYRTPPEGELLANVAQGGNLTFIKKEEIPSQVLQIAEIVKHHFKDDYCFGVDIGFVGDTPKIIELNSRIALFSPDRGEEFSIFMKKLAQLLTK